MRGTSSYLPYSWPRPNGRAGSAMQTCTWPVQVSTSHVQACSLACMPARDSCTPEVPARREFERYADQRLWQGDSVTHCETRADGRHHQFHEPNRVPGSSEKLHLVKRFTPASDETIIYPFTLKTVPRPRSYGQFAGDTFHTTCLVRSIRSIDRANS